MKIHDENKVIFAKKCEIKILKIMKLTSLLILCSTLQIYATGYSQSRKLTIKLDNASITDVFKVIEMQSDFKFLYHDALVSDKKDINIDVKDETVEEVLNGLLAETNETYKVLENNLIVITPKSNEALQEVKIKGKVTTSETGEPLPGVNVVIKGTTTGTVTDIDGKYELVVPSENSVLVFSFVSYATQEVKVGNQTAIDIALTESVKSLDEVVVIGYGSVKKKEITGAIASVKEKDFNQGAITNPFQLIQGQVAGLSVVRPNGGDPTSGLEIRIRGASSFYANQDPLVVLDGVAVGDLKSISISPEDIESMDVLKDGSAAAIYGTRGNSGVILITTKHGNRGQTQVEFSSKLTTESVLKETEVLTGDEYRELKNKLLADPPGSDLRIAGKSMQDLGSSTDWFDQIIRKPLSQNYYLAVSGGNDKSSYRASFNYLNQQGIMLTSGNEEYKMNMNASQLALNDILKFDFQMGLDNFLQHPVDYDAIRQSEQFNPTAPVHNPDGTLYENYNAWQYMNPVGELIQRTRDNSGLRNFGNFGVTLNLTNSLKINAIGGIQANKFSFGYYEPSYSYPQVSAGTNGFAQLSTRNSTTETFESTIAWTKHTNIHNIDLVGGYSFQQYVTDTSSASNKNFISDDVLYNALQTGDIPADGNMAEYSYKEKSNLVAFFARTIYNFKSKYFLTASVRREGSSKFGINNKWGIFPAVSAGWDIAREDFMNGLKFDQLKFRIGYGVTGNQNIPSYLSLVQYNPSGTFYYNGENITGYGPTQDANPDLKWETKTEENIGIDWAILGNRLGGTLDLYTRTTNGLLGKYQVPVPPNVAPTMWANAMSMQNSGIEILVKTIPVKKQKFEWESNLSFEYRTSKILSLKNQYYSLTYEYIGAIPAPGISAWTHVLQEGLPLGNISGYKYLGLDSVGGFKYLDANHDGKININDRVVIGNSIPKYYLGFTNNFQYGNWGLSIMCRGMFNFQIINEKRIWSENPLYLPNNLLKSTLNSQFINDPNFSAEPDFSSLYVENGDFLKIDNVTLSYTMPFKNSKWIKNGKVFITGTNLLVITGYKGNDPEVSFAGLTPGIDNMYGYPSTRTYTFGINLIF